MKRRGLLQAALGGAMALVVPRLGSAQVPDDITAHYLGLYTRSWVSDGFTGGIVRLDTFAVELDSVDTARELVPIATKNALHNIGEQIVGKIGQEQHSPLTDQGMLYFGVIEEDGVRWRFAIIMVRQGALVYSLMALGVNEQTGPLIDVYSTLFDPDRREQDVLPTDDEVPSNLMVADDSMVV